MLVSIAAGIPCIVSHSASYRQLAKQFDLMEYVVDDTSDLRSALIKLNDLQERKKYLKEIQPYILNQYSSKNITLKFLRAVENYM